jgi:hypothetical protein
MANSDYPNHVVLVRELRAYLRWRNANNRLPDVLAAQGWRARPGPQPTLPKLGPP